MEYSDRSNNLPMVRTIQNQERDTYHQNISVDSHYPESDATNLKGGEIQAFGAFERGEEKWCREHIQPASRNSYHLQRGSKPPRRHGQMT